MTNLDTSRSFPTDVLIASLEASGTVTLDPAQRQLVSTVQDFLVSSAAEGAAAPTHTGFYIYGPPGRGKTWLMTHLFDTAPFLEETKRHVHFHDFFRQLQAQLGPGTSMRQAIDATLEDLLTGTQLFFFDELHVHDPGSATLLNRLLATIAEHRIPTLITSNYPPDGLLPDMMFHHVVEPGIEIIQEHFWVQTLDYGTDYRQNISRPQTGFSAGRWITHSQDNRLSATGSEMPQPAECTTVLEGHRKLTALATRGTEIWFDFTDLLEAPSITSDFMEVADQYSSWVVINVPLLSHTDSAAQQRFVTLIDVLVERDIPLTIISSHTREQVLGLDDPPVDFFRTVSRLALLHEDG